MKYLYTVIMAMLVFASCSENERMVYTDMSGVYFPDYVTGADSLVYSFRMKGAERDTIQINVKLLGDLLSETGEYEVAVSENSSADSLAISAHRLSAECRAFVMKPSSSPKSTRRYCFISSRDTTIYPTTSQCY